MDVLMDCILQIINVVYSTECVLFESKSSGSTISIWHYLYLQWFCLITVERPAINGQCTWCEQIENRLTVADSSAVHQSVPS